MKTYKAGEKLTSSVNVPEAITSKGGLNGGMLVSGSVAQADCFIEEMGKQKRGMFLVEGKNGKGVVKWSLSSGGKAIRFTCERL